MSLSLKDNLNTSLKILKQSISYSLINLCGYAGIERLIKSSILTALQHKTGLHQYAGSTKLPTSSRIQYKESVANECYAIQIKRKEGE